MAGSQAFARIKKEIFDIVSRVPSGWVTTNGDIGRALSVQPRHVAYILTTLDDLDRETIPWWRVVAEGGAVGRHKRRDAQLLALRNDGVPLSGVGVVQDFSARRIPSLQKPPTAAFISAPEPDGRPPSRSRGMKSH